MTQDRFWEYTRLEDMSTEQWESLCDHCGRCCLLKIEDIDSGDLFYTNVICKLHDARRNHCSRYSERHKRVPDCVKVTVELAREADWLPHTCAYRLLATGQPLRDWHPLLSGSRDSVRRAGISVRDKAISETYVHPDELTEHLVNWFDEVPRRE